MQVASVYLDNVFKIAVITFFVLYLHDDSMGLLIGAFFQARCFFVLMLVSPN